MRTLTRTSTTEMEVTSIRLERTLKDKLKELSGNQGGLFRLTRTDSFMTRIHGPGRSSHPTPACHR